MKLLADAPETYEIAHRSVMLRWFWHSSRLMNPSVALSATVGKVIWPADGSAGSAWPDASPGAARIVTRRSARLMRARLCKRNATLASERPPRSRFGIGRRRGPGRDGARQIGIALPGGAAKLSSGRRSASWSGLRQAQAERSDASRIAICRAAAADPGRAARARPAGPRR